MAYQTLNAPSHGTITVPSSAKDTFPNTLTITPSTTKTSDIWRKPGPPEVSTFNAPVLFKKVELKIFQSVKVKVTADWKGLYDQGGLVFILPDKSTPFDASDSESLQNLGKNSKWVKTGIEFYNGQALVSTVVRDRWADWSLYPIPTSSTSVTLLIDRLPKDDTFWIYIVSESTGEKHPIREVTWVLSENEGAGEVWVGVYAATPNVTGIDGKEGERDGLEVRFEGLEFGERDV